MEIIDSNLVNFKYIIKNINKKVENVKNNKLRLYFNFISYFFLRKPIVIITNKGLNIKEPRMAYTPISETPLKFEKVDIASPIMFALIPTNKTPIIIVGNF